MRGPYSQADDEVFADAIQEPKERIEGAREPPSAHRRERIPAFGILLRWQDTRSDRSRRSPTWRRKLAFGLRFRWIHSTILRLSTDLIRFGLVSSLARNLEPDYEGCQLDRPTVQETAR